MDTISFKVITKNEEDLLTVKLAIKTKYWCEVLNTAEDNLSMRMKLSYPRFFESTNAYLISSSRECLQVHAKLIDAIKEYEYKGEIKIKLIRVDIPFTYLMEREEEFNGYRNVFKYITEVYKFRNSKSEPKTIMSSITEDVETYLIGSTSNPNKSDRKICIYNQYKRFQDTHPSIPSNYSDLKQRIRLEVCNRIKRKDFTLEEFRSFDIYKEYFDQYKKYILHNAFNLSVLDEIQNLEIQNMKKLIREHKKKPNFSYKGFIHENRTQLKDYRVLRAAMEFDLSGKSLEKAVTKVRKVLMEIEKEEGIIILNTYREFVSIRNFISNSIAM